MFILIMNNELTRQFYQNLGKLFYAIAAVDNSVRKEEVSAVEKLVETYWLQQDLIDFQLQNEAKNAIMDTFKWLCEDNEYDAETCYTSFINFKKQNSSIFTDQINSLILKTASKITSSFSGQNKSEIIMLAKLNIELKKNKK